MASKHVIRPSLLFLLLGFLAWGALPSCQESQKDRPSSNEIVIGFPSAPDSLSPFLHRSSRSALILEQLVSLPLLERSPQGKSLKPALAASMPLRNGNRIRWQLRPEARFSDGSPLTSENVKRTIEALLARKSPGRLADSIRGVLSVEVIDKVSFELTYAKCGYLDVERFGSSFIVLHDQALATQDNREILKFSSGPFVVIETGTGETELERRRPWWGDSCPDLSGRFQLKKLRLRYVSDQGTLPILLKEGVIDLAPLSGKQAKAVDSSLIRSASFSTSSFSFVGWNCGEGIMADAHRRRLMAQVIPRDLIAKRNDDLQVHPGLYRESSESLLAKPVTASEWKKAGIEDVDGDGQLEWGNGPLSLRVLAPAGNIPWLEATLTSWREAASQAGFVLEIERLSVPVLLKRLEERSFDAFVLIWRVPQVEPSFSDLLHGSQVGKNGRNFMGVRSKKLDRLLNELESCFSPNERAKRRQVLASLVQHDQPLTPLFAHRAFLAYRILTMSCEVAEKGIVWSSLRARSLGP